MVALLLKPNMSPKKKPHPASQFRREWQTADDIREAADELKKQMVALQELATMMDENRLKSVLVDGVRKFPNAIKLLTAYQKNVHKACIDSAG